MNTKLISKIHRKAVWGLGAVFIIGMLLPSLHQGDHGPSSVLWVTGVALYIPFYVLHSNVTGEIDTMYSVVSKKELPILFRVVQTSYIIFAAALVIVGLSNT